MISLIREYFQRRRRWKKLKECGYGVKKTRFGVIYTVPKKYFSSEPIPGKSCNESRVFENDKEFEEHLIRIAELITLTEKLNNGDQPGNETNG